MPVLRSLGVEGFTTRQIAAIYDQIGLDFSLTRPKMSAQAKSLLPPLPPKARVLDLGCGNGVLLTSLTKGTNYTGIDISRILIEEAKKLHPHTNFILADITQDSAWQNLGLYDFIAALAVFHHLPTASDHLKLLQNIKQHLKQNGTCLISVWLFDQLKLSRFHINNHHLSIPFHPARNAAHSAAGGGGPNRLFYAFTKEELTMLAKKAGFVNINSVVKAANLYLTIQST